MIVLILKSSLGAIGPKRSTGPNYFGPAFKVLRRGCGLASADESQSGRRGHQPRIAGRRWRRDDYGAQADAAPFPLLRGGLGCIRIGTGLQLACRCQPAPSRGVQPTRRVRPPAVSSRAAGLNTIPRLRTVVRYSIVKAFYRAASKRTLLLTRTAGPTHSTRPG